MRNWKKICILENGPFLKASVFLILTLIMLLLIISCGSTLCLFSVEGLCEETAEREMVWEPHRAWMWIPPAWGPWGRQQRSSGPALLPTRYACQESGPKCHLLCFTNRQPAGPFYFHSLGEKVSLFLPGEHLGYCFITDLEKKNTDIGESCYSNKTGRG